MDVVVAAHAVLNGASAERGMCACHVPSARAPDVPRKALGPGHGRRRRPRARVTRSGFSHGRQRARLERHRPALTSSRAGEQVTRRRRRICAPDSGLNGPQLSIACRGIIGEGEGQGTR